MVHSLASGRDDLIQLDSEVGATPEFYTCDINNVIGIWVPHAEKV